MMSTRCRQRRKLHLFRHFYFIWLGESNEFFSLDADTNSLSCCWQLLDRCVQLASCTWSVYCYYWLFCNLVQILSKFWSSGTVNQGANDVPNQLFLTLLTVYRYTSHFLLAWRYVSELQGGTIPHWFIYLVPLTTCRMGSSWCFNCRSAIYSK